jgi:integrase
MIKKTEAGYLVDLRPNGRDSRRVRKLFKTRSEAMAFEKHTIAEESQKPAWQQQKTDSRRLSEIIDVWFELHGKQLKSSEDRLLSMKKCCKLMGNPKAAKIDAKLFAKFRAERLETVTANTANHDLAYFRAMFNELERVGEWHSENPLDKIRRIKIDEAELCYLTHAQIKTLLDQLDKSPSSHAGISARVALATGARWGEVATIKPSQIANGLITYSGTKSGKNRSIPIDKRLQSLIMDNAPLVDGMNTFKRAMPKLNLQLPKGQMTHVLRHTFASHYMINGGNIITLQRILGHASITMTMRYAHLSPDHLTDAITKNPLATMSTF